MTMKMVVLICSTVLPVVAHAQTTNPQTARSPVSLHDTVVTSPRYFPPFKYLVAQQCNNRKLKQLVADLSLDKHILQDVLSKKS